MVNIGRRCGIHSWVHALALVFSLLSTASISYNYHLSSNWRYVVSVTSNGLSSIVCLITFTIFFSVGNKTYCDASFPTAISSLLSFSGIVGAFFLHVRNPQDQILQITAYASMVGSLLSIWLMITSVFALRSRQRRHKSWRGEDGKEPGTQMSTTQTKSEIVVASQAVTGTGYTIEKAEKKKVKCGTISEEAYVDCGLPEDLEAKKKLKDKNVFDRFFNKLAEINHEDDSEYEMVKTIRGDRTLDTVETEREKRAKQRSMIKKLEAPGAAKNKPKETIQGRKRAANKTTGQPNNFSFDKDKEQSTQFGDATEREKEREKEESTRTGIPREATKDYPLKNHIFGKTF